MVTTKACLVCGAVVTRPYGTSTARWEARTTCSRTCALTRATAAPGRRRGPTIRVADVAWLAQSGETGERIANRLNVKPGSLLQGLRRRGEHDLADLCTAAHR